MPRRLAVAKHAGGFDAVGWTLLGFLLGASLAVLALLHADIRGMIRPFVALPSPPAASAVVSYAPPATPSQPVAPPPVIEQAAAPPPTPVAAPRPPVDALAVAGAASVHAAGEARPRTTDAAAPRPSRASSAADDAQVDADAAAAGMTSRATAPAAPAVTARSPTPELY